LFLGINDRVSLKMAPTNFDFVEWWNKEQLRGGTPVVVKMANPNYTMLEIESPKAGGFGGGGKDKGKNAKQLTWVLLLKAHRAAGCLAWMALGLWTVLAAIKKRLILRQGLAPPPSTAADCSRPLQGFWCLQYSCCVWR
jgi:hypothetical protein